MVEGLGARIVFGLTVGGGGGLLGLAVWPGLIQNAVFNFLLVCFTVPLLGCWFFLLVGLAVWDVVEGRGPAGRRRRWGLRSSAVMFATLGLLWFHAPQRAAFAFCCSDLRGLVDNAPVAENRGGVELDRRVGPYAIDRYGADRRGGVYFRTATGPDGIGPDQMSFGFAFRPNDEGSPFGNARYHRYHLFGDWYGFAVSDDS